jgi:5'-nucleotidase
LFSHLGYNYKNEPDKICDLQLAAQQTDIDLIIGGHTHTFLDKPTVKKQHWK